MPRKDIRQMLEGLGEQKVKQKLADGDRLFGDVGSPYHQEVLIWLAEKNAASLKKIQENKSYPAPDHWYKKPIGVIGIAITSGVLLYLALFIIRNHAGIP